MIEPMCPHDGRRKTLAKLGAVILQLTGILIGGTFVSTEAQATTSQCSIGSFNPGNGYNAALWVDKSFFASGSTACTNFYSQTNYSVVWNGKYQGYDVLGGLGLAALQKYTDSVSQDANAWHHHNFPSTNTGRGIFTLYGWAKNTKTEWYIVDDWFGFDNVPTGQGDWQDTVWIDDDYYDVYHLISTADDGTPFNQWWSIRQHPRSEGVISYPQHFAEWRQLGFPNQMMREIRFIVEANGRPGRGKLDVYSIDLLSNAP